MDFGSHHHTLTRCLVERGHFDSHPLTVLDVGCGGGIAPLWRRFEPSLRVLGVDPQISECRRLNAEESNRQVRYVPAFLGLPDDHPFRQARGARSAWTANPWERLSAARAMAILRAQTPPAERVAILNEWHETPLVETAQKLGVDDLAAREGLHAVDFIKIDVDGPDLEVILSAENTVRQSPVLGVVMEVNFFGSADPTDHSFHNVDRLLRQWGFELFDLSTRRFSAAALPAPFRYEGSPAETTWGRLVQGDALYLRDPAGWPEHPAATVPLDPVGLLKLACLFEIFGLPDHAAELLRDRTEELAPLLDTKPLLHLLANEVDPSFDSYDRYLERFHANPAAHYPSHWLGRTGPQPN